MAARRFRALVAIGGLAFIFAGNAFTSSFPHRSTCWQAFVFIMTPYLSCLGTAVVYPSKVPKRALSWIISVIVLVAGCMAVKTASIYADTLGCSALERTVRVAVASGPPLLACSWALTIYRTQGASFYDRLRALVVIQSSIRILASLVLWLTVQPDAYPPGVSSLSCALMLNGSHLAAALLFPGEERRVRLSRLVFPQTVRLSDLTGAGGGGVETAACDDQKPPLDIPDYGSVSELTSADTSLSRALTQPRAVMPEPFAPFDARDAAAAKVQDVSWITSFPALNGGPYRPRSELTQHTASFSVGGVRYQLRVRDVFLGAGTDTYIFDESNANNMGAHEGEDSVVATHMVIEAPDRSMPTTRLHLRYRGRHCTLKIIAQMHSRAPG